MPRSLLICAAVALGGVILTGQTPTPVAAKDEAALMAKARDIHDRVIALDTHDDISPANFTAEKNYTVDLGNQVNLPKMFKGGLDTAFFIVYVGQNRTPEAFTPAGYDNVHRQAVEKFDAIHRLTKEFAPNQIELALTSADVRRINKLGKKVAMIGVENGYSLGDETTAIARVKEFHERGARYLSLAHNGHSQLADSNTGEADGVWLHKGLSPLGKQVIAELNRTGIMVDISHPSKEANLQAMALSRAPVIASHSSARALCDHSRNLDDEQLLALKENGGVAQAVALAAYVKTPPPPSPERTAAIEKLAAEFGLPASAVGRGGGGRGPGGTSPLAALSEEKRAELRTKMEDVNAKFPAPPRANVKDFVDHLDYMVKKIGIDHVGISSDFDGGGGIDGWADASETFNVTLELVRRGYTEPQIVKIWGGNLLRVLDKVQSVAKDLQKQQKAVPGVQLASSHQQPKTVQEEFSAIYTNISNVGAVGALPVTIRITRWTGDDEHVNLMRMLSKDGNESLLRALQDGKSVGSIGTPQQLAYDLRYARQYPLEGGGRRIILMTDRPMTAFERLSASVTRDYPLTWIELKLDAAGQGEGSMFLAARLRLIGDVLGIEDFANQPAKLNDVKKVK